MNKVHTILQLFVYKMTIKMLIGFSIQTNKLFLLFDYLKNITSSHELMNQNSFAQYLQIFSD